MCKGIQGNNCLNQSEASVLQEHKRVDTFTGLQRYNSVIVLWPITFILITHECIGIMKQFIPRNHISRCFCNSETRASNIKDYLEGMFAEYFVYVTRKNSEMN